MKSQLKNYLNVMAFIKNGYKYVVTMAAWPVVPYLLKGLTLVW